MRGFLVARPPPHLWRVYGTWYGPITLGLSEGESWIHSRAYCKAPSLQVVSDQGTELLEDGRWDGQWSGLTDRGEWPLVSAGTPTVCSGQGWLSGFCDWKLPHVRKSWSHLSPDSAQKGLRMGGQASARIIYQRKGCTLEHFLGAAPKKPQREPEDESLPGSQSMKPHSRNCPCIFTYPIPEGSNQHPVRWEKEEEGGKTKTPHLVLCWQETTL